MRILLYLLLAPLFVFAQGEQRYADGTATDQDGNTFERINYGTQDWAIENAEVVNYRDGTSIPQVTDATEWQNLTTGAWCYYDNDPAKGKLYNWYAVAGIHDNDPNTPNKEFAPEGWHVPSDAEWTTLQDYLIANGYNFDGTTSGNKIAKSMSSTTEWENSDAQGEPGNNQSINNNSGFNSYPKGFFNSGDFLNRFIDAAFWAFNPEPTHYYILYRSVGLNSDNFNGRIKKNTGLSVRFIKDASSVGANGDILLNGTVSAENNQIKNVADPTDQQDAVTNAYLETKLNDEKPNIEQVLEKGNNANGIQLKNLADPTENQDAVTLITLLQKISELQAQLDVLNTSNTTGIMYDLEGNEYGTILMCDGKQWTTNYLNVSFFENGDPIPEVTENDAWRDLNTPAYCYLDNQDRGRGKIYNWFAVNDSRGLAPQGWHIATEDEWNQLINCLGGVEVAGGKLKMSGTEYWESPNVGSTTTGMASNSSGMGLLPDGFREGANGNFFLHNEFVSIWNKSNIDDRRPYVQLLNNLAKINVGLTDPYDGAHILLIKDYE